MDPCYSVPGGSRGRRLLRGQTSVGRGGRKGGATGDSEWGCDILAGVNVAGWAERLVLSFATVPIGESQGVIRALFTVLCTV